MSETINQTLTRLTSLIQEKAPNIDLAPGSVFNELILGLESQIQNQVYNDMSDISMSQTISDVINSIVDTYSPVIDRIASNYNVTRNQGSASAGQIKVYVTAKPATDYTLLAGVSFTQSTLGYVYNTTESKTLKIDDDTFTQEGEGRFYFILAVASPTVGLHTVLTNGAPFNLTSTNAIPNYIESFAHGSFSAGLDQETDKQLIARFRQGLSVGNLLSSASLNSKLTSLYPSFRGAFLTNTTSKVNKRGLSSIMNIKIPGCVDVYVKNDITIPQITIPVGGTYIGSTEFSNNTWVLDEISSDLLPGFYRIENVEETSDTELINLSFKTTYSFDTTSDNLIQTAADARYSIYQKATVYVSRASNNGQGMTFNVTALVPYQLKSIQDLVNDPDQRIPCADYLIKGIVPCMVNMDLSLVRKSQGDIIDVAALKGDIFNYVNSLPIGQPIAVSKIIDICHNYNIARVDLPLIIAGTILAPYDKNGDAADQNITIDGNDFLSIPELPQYGVIPENTMFFLNYYNNNHQENINISIK
jgi:hypothetical protein